MPPAPVPPSPDLALRSQFILLPLCWDPTLAQPGGVAPVSADQKKYQPLLLFLARPWHGEQPPLLPSCSAQFRGVFAVGASSPATLPVLGEAPWAVKPTDSHPPEAPFQPSLPDVSTNFSSFIYHFNKYFFSVIRSIWGISPRCSTGTHGLLTSALSWPTGAALQ